MICALAIAMFCLSTGRGEETLTTAAEVAHFPENDAEKQPLVKLEAVVTYIDSSGTVFLADMTGATFLSRVKNTSFYEPGQVLAVEGRRLPGLFIGGIIPSKTEVIGDTPPHPARSVTLRELSSGKFHYQLVAMEGIVRSVERADEAGAVLKLSVQGGEVAVRFDRAPSGLENLVDAEVRVEGLAAGGINDRRQLVSPYLKAAPSGAVTVMRQAPTQAPEVKVSDLTGQPDGPAHRVRVRGVALSPLLKGSFFIRDATGALKVTPFREVEISPGNDVEVTGFPAKGSFSPYLEGAEVRAGESLTFPGVTVVDGENMEASSLDNDLVTVTGTLGGAGSIVLALAGREVSVVPPPEGMPSLETGSKVRLTGIWQVTDTSLSGYNSRPSAFSLLLRSAEDVEILSAPSWWTARRLGVLLAVISACGLIALGWAAALRAQVSSQVKLIEAKNRREAVTEERQRIAREFHDTLEQELAGLSIRLDAALPRVPDETAAGLLTQLRALLLRMQTETRDFILDLRETDPAPLRQSLGDLLESLRQTTDIPLELETENIPEMPPHTRHHLLRITREAVNNAITHSGAKRIAVSLTAEALVIRDDGTGFDPATSGMTRFGIQGMKERAKKIGSVLTMTSSSGNGTSVEVRFRSSTAH